MIRLWLVVFVVLVGFLSAPVWALTIQKAVKIGQKTCDLVSWTDAAGLPRSVALVRSDGDVLLPPSRDRNADENDPANPAGRQMRGGYIEQYTYSLGDRQVTARSDETMAGVSGLGCAVNHHARASTSKSNSTDATTAFILEGTNHCIWRFSSQYHGPSQPQGEDKKSHDAVVGLVIDYFIADGRSDILWAVSYDCSKLKDGEIAWDARGPYFQFDWDGDGKFFGAPISGIRWGDRYKFRTVQYAGNDSTWDYTQPNQIPYMMLYKEGAQGDASCAVIQTLPWTQKPAGGYWWSAGNWGKSGKGMMPNWNCPFQLNAYEGYGGEKMAWGNPYGMVGTSTYQTLDGKTSASGYPFQGYSVLIVTSRHSEGLADKLIASLETVQSTKLTATKGKPATTLPGYAGLAQTVDCVSPGWDGVYGWWAIECQPDGQAQMNFDTGSGALLTPTVCFSGFTAGKATLTLNGKPLQEGKDYFATIDAAGQRLLVTFTQPFAGPTNTIAVAPAGN